MKRSGLDIDVTDRGEQRKFGLVMAVAFAVVAGVRSWLAGEVRPLLFGVAVAFLIVGLAAPFALRPVLKGWIRLALALNWVMTRLLLSLTFFGLFVPMRVFRSLFAEDALKRAWREDASSYWEDAEEQPEDLESYSRQF